MDQLLTHLEPAHLLRPERGSSSRFRLGRLELILEPVRGGYTLLCSDGSSARSWSLGLSPEGSLWIACRLPRWPLRIGLRETLALVPKSRVRGYLNVPLVPTLLWRRPGHADAQVCELLPNSLTAEWEESSSLVVQRVVSPFLQRMPLPEDQLRAVVPVTIRNDSESVQCPEALPLLLADEDLGACRQHLVARPQRLFVEGDGRIRQVSRARQQERLP